MPLNGVHLGKFGSKAAASDNTPGDDSVVSTGARGVLTGRRDHKYSVWSGCRDVKHLVSWDESSRPHGVIGRELSVYGLVRQEILSSVMSDERSEAFSVPNKTHHCCIVRRFSPSFFFV